MKLQVLVSDEMAERIDKRAKEIGVSRSAFCAMLIGQGLLGFDRASDIMDSLKDEFISNPELLAKM